VRPRCQHARLTADTSPANMGKYNRPVDQAEDGGRGEVIS
jgi:hypothetical protein